MTAPSFTYSGNVYTAASAGSVNFALTSTSGNPIAYLERAHIHVYKSANSGVTWTELSRPSQWDFVSSGTVARLAAGISAGEWVKVQRITPSGAAYVTFQSSALLTAEQLNDDTLFNTYLNQEIEDLSRQTVATADAAVVTANTASTNASNAVITANAASAAVASKLNKAGDSMTGALDMGGNKVIGVGAPTNADDVATKSYVDGFVSQTANIANSAVTTAKIADANVTTGKVADGAITSAKIADGTIATGDIGNLQITNAKIADSTITSAKLTPETVVTSSELAGLTPDNASFYTTLASDNRYFRQDSSETINSGLPWSGSDSFIATTAAIDARIIDLVDDVGGFVPIASETSFPLTNPDINNPDGAGTIISVKEIVTTRTPSSGTVTIANGAGSNTVTITGCGSTVLASGFGVLVETTSTLHTYTFHRLVPKATEVTTVASISGNVTTVAGISANVTTVAGNNSNVTTVAANIADVQTVAADLNEPVSEIDTVATNIGNVNTVGTNISSVNTVAGSNANVGTVATSIANVNTVAGSIGSVNTSAANIANINTVATNNSNVTTCATNMAAILAAPTQAANAATSATNAANSASAASSLVTTITNLSYLLNWGLITEAAGTSSDYGAL